MNLAQAIEEAVAYDNYEVEKDDVWNDWEGYVVNHETKQTEMKIKCTHQWVPTLLVFTTVWDCKHCGAKKENAGVDSQDVMW